METTTDHTKQRTAGREHHPLYPKGFIAVRIVQLVLSLITLGLSAYGVAFLVFSGDTLMLFTSIVTLIICIYYIVAEFAAPAIYNYWAVLSLDIFLLIFWLISFALLAAQVAPYMAGYTECDYLGYCYTYSLTAAQMRYADALAAAAGIGGLEFILFIVSLAIHSVMLHRHRKAGLHSMPGSAATHNAGQVPPAAGEKVEMQPQTQTAYPQQIPQQQQQQQQQQHHQFPVQQPMPPQGYAQQPHPGYTGQASPPPAQQMYTAPPQEQMHPQQAPSPLSAQETGNPYPQPAAQHQPDLENPGQGPYEAHGQSFHGYSQ